MVRQADGSGDYWRADDVVEAALGRFQRAVEADRPDRQRSAYYRLAKYQARTVHILHSGFDSTDEALVQAALHNLMALQRGLLAMQQQATLPLPLPVLLGEEAQESLTSDLIMRVLKESGGALTVDGLVARLTNLDLLGPVEPADITDNLERLLQAHYVTEQEGRYSATTRPYNEIDLNMRLLRGLLGPRLYPKFHKARIRRLSHVNARPGIVAEVFAPLTGMTDPATRELFAQTCALLYRVSLAAVRPWHFRELAATPIPRPYQQEAYQVFRNRSYLGSVIEAPTGSGKTMIGMLCITDGLRTLQPGQSMLILVPTAAYQQQWFAALCFDELGLQLSPEVVFAGSPAQLGAAIRRTGQHPAIVLLTYTGLSQLASGTGKGGFDRASLEMFLQQANVQAVLLDEVHKVVADMHSVATEVTRVLVEWRGDNSIRGLVGFSGTAEAYRSRFAELGLDLVHSVPIDDLVAAGFVAPFTELGVPFARSAREQQIRESLEQVKAGVRDLFALVGSDRLRAWFNALDLEDRLRIGHEVLGMYRGRRDWRDALTARFAEWESGGELNLTEANLALIVQIARGWSDAELARQAGVDRQAFDELRQRVAAARSALAERIYLPVTLRQLAAPGFMTDFDTDALSAASALPSAARRADATREVLSATVTGLYTAVRGWYQRVGEGRVETIKAVMAAERALRPITGTIVFDVGRRIHWRRGTAAPGYEGVAGLFGQILGDSRFTVLAALSSELYLSDHPDDPLHEAIADYIEQEILLGEAADAVLDLALKGLALPEPQRRDIEQQYRERIAAYVPRLRNLRAPRPGEFARRVLLPVLRLVRKQELGVEGDRIASRLSRSNEHLRGLLGTFFDYAMIARSFRGARPARLEQVSGQEQAFWVVPMPSSNARKQLVYELTSRITDAPSLPVNLVIVSSWARTGWNVVTPNLLIDATATSDVTAWQQLRGRALRADRRWTNDCYRLASQILGTDVLAVPGGTAGQGELPMDLLASVASPDQVDRVVRDGFDALPPKQREALAVDLMLQRNKVTHVYELVKAYGTASQIRLDRGTGQWRRKDSIAAKHTREVAVNARTGVKSQGEEHAELVIVGDPREDVPQDLQRRLTADLAGSDERIVRGWLHLAQQDQSQA
jgi:hypothetical protein